MWIVGIFAMKPFNVPSMEEDEENYSSYYGNTRLHVSLAVLGCAMNLSAYITPRETGTVILFATDGF